MRFVITIFLGILQISGFTQVLEIDLHPQVFEITRFFEQEDVSGSVTLFSVDINDSTYFSAVIPYRTEQSTAVGIYRNIQFEVRPSEGEATYSITMKNLSDSAVSIKNLVPLGKSKNQVYLTGKGDHYLSRSHLFIPDLAPVNVILPDNAWELGYGSLQNDEGPHLCALARRIHSDQAKQHRFETILEPEGSVTYHIWIEYYQGIWQNGLKKVFQDRLLFDSPNLDREMYGRQDLAWIRESYMSHLLMAWDDWFYNRETGDYQLIDFIQERQLWYGGDDFIGIWPTWPSLGLDQRNQWDLYRSLPGGLKGFRELTDQARSLGTKLFISYNPWDQSSRPEDHLQGIQNLIKETDVDGVILDTRGSSSKALQQAADDAKDGVIMYSEGMAVPKHMDNIISGRVHNALYYPPILNLNRVINPDFAVFRVAELYREKINREFNLCLFNGHGIEINAFRPGRPPWIEEQYKKLGHVLYTLRTYSDNFHHKDWVPLYVGKDSTALINYWPGEKVPAVYTIINFDPDGNEFYFEPSHKDTSIHYVDVWHYEEIRIANDKHLKVHLDGYAYEDLGTNNESTVSAIAGFYKHLSIQSLDQDQLHLKSIPLEYTIKLWPGRPSYQSQPVTLTNKDTIISCHRVFPDYFGKLVIELYDQQNDLVDVRVWEPEQYDLPYSISNTEKTTLYTRAPQGMVFIPGGRQKLFATQGDQFIPYPKEDTSQHLDVSGFFIDIHPVTNQAFNVFLQSAGYMPADTHRFLAHWPNRVMPEAIKDHPVINVSAADAEAYCAWAGKRLPSQWEWQFAAQAGDERAWPWQAGKTIDKETQQITETLSVEKMVGVDSVYCNTGTGYLDPVGQYPLGVNPHGLYDLVGSVWQLTNDVYANGSYTFRILKGGSYFKPESSWWYVQGGPRPLHYRQMLLEVSPGFERNATVGFRCVADAAGRN